MKKALIVYGTRTGTAEVTAKQIAQTLQTKGIEVKVVNAKKEKVQSITEYGLRRRRSVLFLKFHSYIWLSELNRIIMIPV